MRFLITVSEHVQYEVDAKDERTALDELLTDMHTGSVECFGHSTKLVGNVGTTYDIREKSVE